MVMISSLHVHHETADPVDDCNRCAGHIESGHHHEHDCLYCHFFSQNWLVQDDGQPVDILPATKCISTPTPTVVLPFGHGVAQLRAPPTV